MSDPRDINGDGRVSATERLLDYAHVPHWHIAARSEAGPVKVADVRVRDAGLHGDGVLARVALWLARFNARVALRITLAVGSMWCAYLFTMLTLVSLPDAIKSGNSIVIVSWIAQTFFQLVLLPVILVGQQVIARASDKRAEQTYHDASATLHECLQLQQHLEAQDAVLADLITHFKGAAASTSGGTPS